MKREEYELNPNICGNCGESIPWEKRANKYCNHSCAASRSNIGIRRHGERPGACLNCSNQLDTSLRKYCSRKCQHEFHYKDYIRRWLLGEERGLKGESISVHVRRYIFETRGEECEKCGWDEINPFTQKIPLTIHHINGKWDDNREENLQVLCPNCHALTDNYGHRNKGNGRKSREQWRKDKKCGIDVNG